MLINHPMEYRICFKLRLINVSKKHKKQSKTRYITPYWSEPKAMDTK